MADCSAMQKFNATGSVLSDRHYCLPPLSRVSLREVPTLVEDGKLFVLHAPRQTRKTSVLLALRDLINRGEHGNDRCVYASLESLRTVRRDVGQAMRAILGALAIAGRKDPGGDFIRRPRNPIWTQRSQPRSP